jgi:hypothetical protein
MNKELWFFTNSQFLCIFTYGSGDRPTRTYRYQSKQDFKKAVDGFKKDGYKFIKDQAKN